MPSGGRVMLRLAGRRLACRSVAVEVSAMDCRIGLATRRFGLVAAAIASVGSEGASLLVATRSDISSCVMSERIARALRLSDPWEP
jgi:hypothetical protein